MPEDSPFWDEIDARPDQPDAYLVYADWLSERGDPRAEYVVLQWVARRTRMQVSRCYGLAGSGSFPSIDKTAPMPDFAAEAFESLVESVSSEVADGRKTAVIIAAATIEHSASLISHGESVETVLTANRASADSAIAWLQARAEPATNIESLMESATCTAHGDAAIAETIVSAIGQCGPDGVICIEADTTSRQPIRLDLETGVKIPAPGVQAVLEDDTPEQTARLLICDGTLQPIHLDAIDKMATDFPDPAAPLICLCKDLQPVAPSNGRLMPIPIGEGDSQIALMLDTSCLTGASLLTPAQLLDPNIARPRFCDVRLREGYVLIQGGDPQPNQTDRHHQRLRMECDRAFEAGDVATAEQIQVRLARLFGQVGVVTVGGRDEADTEDREQLCINTLFSARKYIESGGVPGGGAAYYHGACHGDDPARADRLGGELDGLGKALLEPLRILAGQAGTSIEVLANHDAEWAFHAGRMSTSLVGPMEPLAVTSLVIDLAEKTAAKILSHSRSAP